MLCCDLRGQILGRVESASIGPPGSEIPTIPQAQAPIAILGPRPQPLMIPLFYQKLLQPCSGGCQNWRNCATRCRTLHLRSGSDESGRAGATLGMHRPIGSQPAISWVSLQISYCNWSALCRAAKRSGIAGGFCLSRLCGPKGASRRHTTISPKIGSTALATLSPSFARPKKATIHYF
jgi:hypothetical protein